MGAHALLVARSTKVSLALTRFVCHRFHSGATLPGRRRKSYPVTVSPRDRSGRLSESGSGELLDTRSGRGERHAVAKHRRSALLRSRGVIALRTNYGRIAAWINSGLDGSSGCGSKD